MKYALLGYGKMGRAIEAVAHARGHTLAHVVDRAGRGRRVLRTIDAASWRGVTVAFEFTEPGSARDHVVSLLERGVAVVCGTTGWDASDAGIRKAARNGSTAAVIAPNFSLGMNLFYAAVAEAARGYLAVGGYDPWIAEWHHRAKLDAPSGTARRLEALVRDRFLGASKSKANVPIAAVRAGHQPGRHVVGFDGPHDAVTFEHVARGRDGFAEGAVLSAEWLRGRRGVHGFDEVVRDLVRGRGKKGEGR